MIAREGKGITGTSVQLWSRVCTGIVQSTLQKAAAMSRINVVVIDQYHPGMADCTAWLSESPEIRITARSSRVDESGALCASYHPDVLLVSTFCLRDYNPGWCSDVRRESAATRVILVNDALTGDELIGCMSAGARGWVQACDTPLVVKAVQAVHLGETWVSRKLARLLVDRLIKCERSRLVFAMQGQ